MSLIGRTLRNRYRIIEKLGHGGFGDTYLAQDQDLRDDRCVVKHLKRQEHSPDVFSIARRLFDQEAEILHRLGKHDQIPHLYAYFEEGGEFYLVQEFVEGQDLSREIVPEKAWSEKEVVQLLTEILAVLEFVHQENVIHRDLKPSNIMRRKQGNKLILIDFGAVKEISSLSTNSQGQTTTVPIGTPGYMPSEQNDGHPKLSSDVYAVGMIGIQALTGVKPRHLQRNSDTEVIWRDRAKVRDSLADVLNKMVKYNYQQRYQNASEALKALKKHSPNWFSRSIADLKSLRIPTVTFSLGLVLALVAVAFQITTTKQQPDQQPDQQPNQQPNQQTDQQTDQQAPLSLICSSTGDFISCGEEILDTSYKFQLKPNQEDTKKKGVDLFKQGNYEEAFKVLKRSWSESQDPETLIYLNNALLEATKIPSPSIAVIIPILREEDGSLKNAYLAQEMLRGVSQAQTQINFGFLVKHDNNEIVNEFINAFENKLSVRGQGINNFGLKVVIADDSNNEDKTKKIATKISDQGDILGVVGSNASDMTKASVDIYDQNKLVLISSGSTTKELTQEPKEFFFRVVGNTELEAESLVSYLIQKDQKQAAIFYNTKSPYTRSLYQEFTQRFVDQGGTIVKISNNLFDSEFNAENEISRLTEETAIVLFPDGQVTNALDNALEIIKANKGRNWIAAGSPMYSSRTIEIGEPKSLEKLVIYNAWHRNYNRIFSQETNELWKADINSRTALSYDATMTLIEAIARQEKPTSKGTQEKLKASNFKAYGATGAIEFCSNNGDRKKPPATLIKVQKSNNNSLKFVPVEDFNRESLDLKDCP